jgi:hypothetical protein
MNQLEIRFSLTNRAEIFTRSVSLQDDSSLKISAQKDYFKWKIVSEGGPLNACFCVFACLRDDDWFWFFPVAGQYGIALGRVEVETKILPQFGKTPMLLTNMCRQRKKRRKQSHKYWNTNRHQDIIAVPIFAPPLDQSVTMHF